MESLKKRMPQRIPIIPYDFLDPFSSGNGLPDLNTNDVQRALDAIIEAVDERIKNPRDKRRVMEKDTFFSGEQHKYVPSDEDHQLKAALLTNNDNNENQTSNKQTNLKTIESNINPSPTIIQGNQPNLTELPHPSVIENDSLKIEKENDNNSNDTPKQEINIPMNKLKLSKENFPILEINRKTEELKTNTQRYSLVEVFKIQPWEIDQKIAQKLSNSSQKCDFDIDKTEVQIVSQLTELFQVSFIKFRYSKPILETENTVNLINFFKSAKIHQYAMVCFYKNNFFSIKEVELIQNKWDNTITIWDPLGLIGKSDKIYSLIEKNLPYEFIYGEKLQKQAAINSLIDSIKDDKSIDHFQLTMNKDIKIYKHDAKDKPHKTIALNNLPPNFANSGGQPLRIVDVNFLLNPKYNEKFPEDEISFYQIT